MSYSFTIAADALADLRKLDAWLQEDVLDEIELLTQDRSLLRGSGGEAVHHFRRDLGQTAYFVSVTLACSDRTQTISILGMLMRTRPHGRQRGV